MMCVQQSFAIGLLAMVSVVSAVSCGDNCASPAGGAGSALVQLHQEALMKGRREYLASKTNVTGHETFEDLASKTDATGESSMLEWEETPEKSRKSKSTGIFHDIQFAKDKLGPNQIVEETLWQNGILPGTNPAVDNWKTHPNGGYLFMGPVTTDINGDDVFLRVDVARGYKYANKSRTMEFWDEPGKDGTYVDYAIINNKVALNNKNNKITNSYTMSFTKRDKTTKVRLGEFYWSIYDVDQCMGPLHRGGKKKDGLPWGDPKRIKDKKQRNEEEAKEILEIGGFETYYTSCGKECKKVCGDGEDQVIGDLQRLNATVWKLDAYGNELYDCTNVRIADAGGGRTSFTSTVWGDRDDNPRRTIGSTFGMKQKKAAATFLFKDVDTITMDYTVGWGEKACVGRNFLFGGSSDLAPPKWTTTTSTIARGSTAPPSTTSTTAATGTTAAPGTTAPPTTPTATTTAPTATTPTATTTYCATCSLHGDPHIRNFDGKKVSFFSLHPSTNPAGPKHTEGHFSVGDYWLVKSPSVSIQARYADGLHLTSAAIGGSFLKNNVLVLEPFRRDVLWNNHSIVKKLPSKFKDPHGLVSVKYHNTSLVGPPSSSSPPSLVGFDVTLPHGISLVANRYQKKLNLAIKMCKPEKDQDGQCGNFNGEQQDDELSMVAKRRSSQVAPRDSLFPVPLAAP